MMCKEVTMATNLNLDPALVDAVRAAGRHRTKKEAVEAALHEYLRRRSQLDALDAFRTFVFEPPARYDYKASRKAR
jgi:Arc/MetJ family transcription regulator